MSIDPVRAFEDLPGPEALDETERSLRAYVASRGLDHLSAYDSSWDDEQLRTWDGNFRSDGALMLVCCERDVDVADYRRVVEEFLSYARRATT